MGLEDDSFPFKMVPFFQGTCWFAVVLGCVTDDVRGVYIPKKLMAGTWK